MPRLLTLCCFIAVGLFAHGQSGFVSWGFDSDSTHFSVQASIGQVFTATTTQSAGFMIEGLQQPHEYGFAIGLPYQSMNHLDIRLFPNPSSGIFYLNFSNPPPTGTHFTLYDATGKIILSQPLDQQQISLDLSGIAAGSYQFVVHLEGALRLFKIQRI
jgi:hypothetical protein